jgi:putative molybdopterin biosynthesis protein
VTHSPTVDSVFCGFINIKFLQLSRLPHRYVCYILFWALFLSKNNKQTKGRRMRGDETLTAKDVAAILHIGKNTVYEMAKEGTLPSYKIGRKLFFTLSAIEEYRTNLLNTSAAAHANSQNGPLNSINPAYLHHASSTLVNSTHQNSGARTATNMPTSFPANHSASANMIGLTEASKINEQMPAFLASPDMIISTKPDAPFVIAGNDIAVDFLCRWLAAESPRVESSQKTCYSALVNMYCHNAAGAVICLYDRRTNTYNTPFVQRLVPGTPVRLMHLGNRKRGLAVAPGNPLKLTTWGALLREGVRLANTSLGSASRVLLDEKLVSLEADPTVITNYDYAYNSEVGAAQAVAEGFRDVAIVGEHVAACVSGVDFVPMQTEWLDVCVLKQPENQPLLRRLATLFKDSAFRAEFANVTHTDASSMGAIVYES